MLCCLSGKSWTTRFSRSAGSTRKRREPRKECWSGPSGFIGRKGLSNIRTYFYTCHVRWILISCCVYNFCLYKLSVVLLWFSYFVFTPAGSQRLQRREGQPRGAGWDGENTCNAGTTDIMKTHLCVYCCIWLNLIFIHIDNRMSNSSNKSSGPSETF